MSSKNRPSTKEHYVAPFEETELGAVDSVRAEGKPTNLYLDAWRDMRRRPMFYISASLILLIVTAALFPGLFTAEDPELGLLVHHLKWPEQPIPHRRNLGVYFASRYLAMASSRFCSA